MEELQTELRRKLDRLRTMYRHGGLGGLLFSLLYKLANRCTRLLIVRTAVVEPSSIIGAHLGKLGAYRHGLCSPLELMPFADDPENDLTPEFLAYAAAQGDSCYAIFDGDILASYCWNSHRPTRIERDLYISVRPGYTYRYKEYTRPSHRGRRLSSYNHAESLRHFSQAGAPGFAGYVEADNYVSYRTLQRMNHAFAGFIVMLGKGPNPWIWRSPKARELDFQVTSSASDIVPDSEIAQARKWREQVVKGR